MSGPVLARRAVVALLLTLAPLAGCRDDGVRVAFRPEVGAVYRYETEVRSEITVTFDGQEPVERRETTTLLARHTVVAAGPDGIRVRVELDGTDGPVRTFVVRYGRGPGVEEVEEVDGTGSGELGEPGLAEIVPAGTGAPPHRRLEPGDDWDVDERVRLPGATRPSRLRGSGRLAALDVADGHDVAEVRSTSRLGVDTVTPAAEGMLTLDGEQETRTSSTHDLDDGAVRRATATTTGRYVAALAPPPGQAAEPVDGTVTVRITSVTRRR